MKTILIIASGLMLGCEKRQQVPAHAVEPVQPAAVVEPMKPEDPEVKYREQLAALRGLLAGQMKTEDYWAEQAYHEENPAVASQMLEKRAQARAMCEQTRRQIEDLLR